MFNKNASLKVFGAHGMNTKTTLKLETALAILLEILVKDSKSSFNIHVVILNFLSPLSVKTKPESEISQSSQFD